MDACLILLYKHFVVVSVFICLIQSVPRAKDTSEQIGLFFVFILENIYILTLDSKQRPKDDEKKKQRKTSINKNKRMHRRLCQGWHPVMHSNFLFLFYGMVLKFISGKSYL